MTETRLETDLTVVGGGGAGVAAALKAGDTGARVGLLEQDDALGGTAATSGGGCLIVGSPLHESEGIHDTPDLAFEDWISGAATLSTNCGHVITSSTRCTISTSGPRLTAQSGWI